MPIDKYEKITRMPDRNAPKRCISKIDPDLSRSLLGGHGGGRVALGARAYLTLLALAWALLFVAVPQAHGSTTATAIELACGPGHGGLAEHVDAAARRYLLHPVLLVAVMANESRCHAGAIGKHHDTGLMQVRGRARNGLSRRALLDPRTNLDTGARWLALMTVWCGSTARGLGAYNSGKCHGSKGYARKVLATVRRIWRELERRQEARS